MVEILSVSGGEHIFDEWRIYTSVESFKEEPMVEILSVMGWVSVVIGLGGLTVFIVWRLCRDMQDSPENPPTKEERELGAIGWAGVLFGLVSLMAWKARLSVPPKQDSPEKPLTQDEHEWLDRQW